MDIQPYFKSVTTIHLAMVAGTTLMFIIVNFILRDGFNFPWVDFNDVLIYPAIFLVIVAILGSPFVFVRAITTVVEDANLHQKYVRYQSANVMKWALIEGPALFLIVCTLLNPTWFYVGGSLVLIILLIMNRPSKEKMSMVMRLSREEQDVLFGR